MVHFKIDSVEPAEYSKPVDPEVEAFVVMYNSGDITFYLQRADLAHGNVQVTVVDSGLEYIERDSDILRKDIVYVRIHKGSQ